MTSNLLPNIVRTWSQSDGVHRVQQICFLAVRTWSQSGGVHGAQQIAELRNLQCPWGLIHMIETFPTGINVLVCGKPLI